MICDRQRFHIAGADKVDPDLAPNQFAAMLAVAKSVKSGEYSLPGRLPWAAGQQFSFRYWRSFNRRSDILLEWRKPRVLLELSSFLHP